MPKTIQTQIDKSQMLLDGLRKNVTEVSNKGITASALDDFEVTLKTLSAANNECDAVRADLSNKVKHMNAALTKAKDQFASLKKVIKGNYLQEEWQRFGIQDKR